MKETLTCSSCSKSWKREVSRGRKPVQCPKCVAKSLVVHSKAKEKVRKVKATPIVVEEITVIEELKSEETLPANSNTRSNIAKVYRDYYPKSTDYEQLMESTKNGSLWHCPACKKDLQCHVPLCDIPTHRCPPNSTRVKKFERIS